MDKSRELKRLQTERSEIKDQLDRATGHLDSIGEKVKKINKALQEANQEYSAANYTVKGLQQALAVNDTRIANLSKDEQEPIVSEHAILRYCERVLGLDIESIKQQILDDGGLKEKIKSLGNGRYPITGGKAQVKNNVIVTILED